MNPEHDAFGHAILDYYEGRNRQEAASFGCRTWFSEYPDWFARDRKAIAHARGRVLDIGCAAGRHALYLQERGHEVVTIDSSPLAIDVCRRRGVQHALVMRATDISGRLGVFDTILMFGNNFGLLGNLRRARWLLRRMHGMTPPEGIILAGAGSYERVQNPAFVARVAENRRSGRLPGEFTVRPRYREYVSRPVKWLYASKQDVERIVDGTGWEVAEFFDDEPPTDAFVALIRKTDCESVAGYR